MHKTSQRIIYIHKNSYTSHRIHKTSQTFFGWVTKNHKNCHIYIYIYIYTKKNSFMNSIGFKHTLRSQQRSMKTKFHINSNKKFIETKKKFIHSNKKNS